MVGLENTNRRIQGFSRGMMQRLGIAQALLNEPRLLICDEPTSALDPIGRKEILDILSIARERTTIVFSTHILSDVERIADSIGVINDGRLILEGPVQKVKNMKRKDIIKLVLGNSEKVNELISRINELPFVLEVTLDCDGILIKLTNAVEFGNEIMSLLVREGIPVLRYEILEPSLENVFLEVVG
jgi:ABC-2 type transport system ATP-binding protein